MAPVGHCIFYGILGVVSSSEIALPINIDHSRFSQVFIANSSSVWYYSGVRSVVECGKLCSSESLAGSPCESFRFESVISKCHLYADGIDTGLPGTTLAYVREKSYPGLALGQIVEPALTCSSASGFSLINGTNSTYCLGILTGSRVDFETAVLDCALLGARLIHFDTADKYSAVATLWTQLESVVVFNQCLWVGASDFRSEGSWVSEFDLQPLTSPHWHWRNGEPNDYMGVEDCACIGSSLNLNDEMCSSVKFPICEIAA